MAHIFPGVAESSVGGFFKMNVDKRCRISIIPLWPHAAQMDVIFSFFGWTT